MGRVRGTKAPAPEDLPESAWSRYEWIVWGTDGSDHRLRIGVGQEGQLTGIIEDVDGDWISEESGN